jgi:chorismate mutase/prephenate dehydratase
MSACLALERPLRIAYLGPPGTFTHAAVETHFGAFVEGVPEASIDEVFRAAESGRADYAVVPVENSTEGAVGPHARPDGRERPGRRRRGQAARAPEPVVEGGVAGEIKRVYSHAQSFAQCVQWLSRHLPSVPRVVAASNAEAARLAAGEPGAAAIAGDMAATIYGLPTLAAHIEDEPNNTTRFWVLGDQHVGASGRDETSLVTSAPNRPGRGATRCSSRSRSTACR